MNYIGSKHRLSDFIKSTISAFVTEDLSTCTFCDLFAGTGMVARSFKGEVKRILANDLEYYSYVLNRHYIANSEPIDRADELIEKLNHLPLRDDGLIYRHYCLGSGSERQFFSDDNGQKIDSLRQQIEVWKKQGEINASQYYFLLTSLIESADKVANTASVYGAFLKALKPTAQKPLLVVPAQFKIDHQQHEVFNEDSNVLIKSIEGDILYLDPPYNARQYGANYHMLNTIAKYDDIQPKGKTGLTIYNKSQYCSKKSVLFAFDELMKNAQFKYIFLSYNNEGLMSVEDVKRIMSQYGTYSLYATEYKRFKADKTEKRNHKANQTEEYLHVLLK